MAIGMQGRGGPSRSLGRYRPMAEINVTPMVDVMLVLLIIFMITAPLMTSGVNVDLPKTSASPVAQETEPLTVSIASDSKVYLQDTAMDLPDLVAKLQAASQNNPDRRILVRGDKDVPYGRIIEVMGTITQGGFTKVALLAEQTGATTPGSGPTGAAAPTVRGGTPAPAAPAPAPVAAPRRR